MKRAQLLQHRELEALRAEGSLTKHQRARSRKARKAARAWRAERRRKLLTVRRRSA